mgnify:CR=1 FL=1
MGETLVVHKYVTHDMVQKARETIADVIHQTPLLPSQTFSQICKRPVFLKAENLQRTGAFKIRGATNFIANIPESQRNRGVIAASAGNHAQGVALASQIQGVHCTIIMPKGASTAKVSATRSYGAEVVLHGQNFEDSQAEAARRGEENHLIPIPAFDDVHVITGQGTIGTEILKDLPDVESVIIPVGGGGLIGGMAVALKEARPDITIYGVQAKSCPAAAVSFAEGRNLEIQQKPSIADGIAIKRPSDMTFSLIQKYVDDIVTVSEDEIAHAILLLMERSKLVVEGAGAVGMAALLQNRIPTEDRKTVVLLSGGNLDASILSRIGNHALAYAGRYLVLRVVLHDRPGELAKLTAVISEAEANVIELDHHRHGIDLSLNQIEAGITVETRDADHVTQVINSLRESGYMPEPPPTPQAQASILYFRGQDT